MTRWIATAETLFDHPVVGMAVPPPPSSDKRKHAVAPMLAWLDIIRSASWKTHQVNHKGKVVTLNRGEFLCGRTYWALRWNWGEQSVRSFFSRLVENKMIEISNQSKGHTSNVASICNFKKYQSKVTDSQPDEKPVPNQCPTSAQPEGNQTIPSLPIKKETTTTTASARVDEGVVVVQSPNGSTIDRFALEVALRKAAGSSIGNQLSLHDTSPIVALIEGGFDLKTQILPSIERTAKQKRPTPIGAWSYFAKVILTEVGQHTATKAEAESIVAATADAAKAKAAKIQREVTIRNILQMTEKLTLHHGVTDDDKARCRQRLVEMQTELPPDLRTMLSKRCEDLRLTL